MAKESTGTAGDPQTGEPIEAASADTKPQAALQRVTDTMVIKTCLWAIPRRIRPNHLTVLRLLLVPVILLLLYYHHGGWALGIFCFAIFTDMVDGAMARARHQTSIFGTYADPIADKLLVAAVLAWVGWPYFRDHRVLGLVVPIFLAFMVLELVVTAVGVPRLVRAGTAQSSNLFGKAKMFAQSLALFLFLIAGMLELATLATVSACLLWAALVLAMVSGGKQVYDVFSKRRQDIHDKGELPEG
jgi:CDP-diacylglycerol--glycerol-3-phosphate 3-phosphatidyltransferase